jgi:threonine aldolase
MKVKDLCAGFDSVSSCLSKGLGAPAGTLLLSSKSFVDEARRARKILGGGMRQAGVIAAAGLYALENNVARLREDHENAARLAKGLRELGLEVQLNTNMVLVKVSPATATALAAQLQRSGIVVLPRAPMRLVTHLDVDAAGIDRAVAAFAQFRQRSAQRAH